MLDIGSLVVIWTKPALLVIATTRPEGLVLCLSLILWPSESGPAGAGSHWASKLALIFIVHLACIPGDQGNYTLICLCNATVNYYQLVHVKK